MIPTPCKSVAFLCATVLLLVARTSAADEHMASTGGTRVTILSDAEGAIVFIDSTRVGVTPLVIDSLSAGGHTLAIVHPDVANWLTGTIADSFTVEPERPLTLRYAIPHRYMVRATAMDERVFAGDSLLGQTPLILPRDPASLSQSISSKKLSIRRSEEPPLLLDVSEARRGILSPPTAAFQDFDKPIDHLLRYESKSGARTETYLTGIGTVLSGVAAAYFKIQADKSYREYRFTGDGALLDRTRRLDNAATVSMVLTQAGFALFAYFLLSEQ